MKLPGAGAGLQREAQAALSEGGARPAQPLVEVKDLVRHYRAPGTMSKRQVIRAVDGVSFDVIEGETLGVVGESGCGKSTLGRLLVKLDSPTSGNVRFEGLDLSTVHRGALQGLRRDLQMIFQDPMGSLDPLWRAERIIAEPLRASGMRDRHELRARVEELLSTVGLDPELGSRLPSEMSGGQRQRVGIARAIATGPRLIVADEPVSALDVSVQAQVVNLLAELQSRLKLSYVFIAHGLEVVRHLSDRVAVMYLGKVVELAPAEELFAAPAHHYTAMLLAAVPSADPGRRSGVAVQGEVGSAMNPPSGCRFNPRCPARQTRCSTEEPVLARIGESRLVACHYPLKAEFRSATVASGTASDLPTFSDAPPKAVPAIRPPAPSNRRNTPNAR